MPMQTVSDSDKEKTSSSKANRYNAEPLPNPILLEVKSRWPKFKIWGLAALALLIGFGGGILVTRHRHNAETVIGAVNGVVITQDQLFSRLQKTSGPAVMHQMVLEQLQLQFAAKKGLLPTQAEVDQKYQQMDKNLNFQASLASSGLSLTDYKQNLRVKMAQVAVLTHGVTATDAEMHSIYAAETDPRNPKAQFYQPEAILLRAIAAPTKQTADKAAQELVANTPFEMVVSQYSVDPSKNNGGLIPTLLRGRSLLSRVPRLEQAIFNLKVGQQLGPIQINNGWWIFRCEEKRPSQTLPFNTVKDDCRVDAELVKGTKLNGKAVAAEFSDFEHKSNLQAFWPQYKLAIEGH